MHYVCRFLQVLLIVEAMQLEQLTNLDRLLATFYFSVSLSILTAIIQVDLSLSPFWILLELRMMEVVVTAGAIRHAKLQSNC